MGGDRGGGTAKLLVGDFPTKSKAIVRSFVCLSILEEDTCYVLISD
ncbi:hypothetical protein ACFFSW_07625 [Saccharothrix longispora]|uniref:Uncharacterized protein n=1 Tax=Saccharothrix longispora TaxID=33920 RepID=A0ABU1PMJ3_9PSEU|nr:hypothetical protein [Saccharothrix longispora]MDR6591776.1 hypothetical protein [Saccharothrix longispora]MDU0293161.1 hypothetical protein [Saccharothrix longispora]